MVGNWKKYCFRDNSIEFESDFCWSRKEKILIILGQNLVIPAIVILGRKPPKEVSALLLLLTEFHSKCWSWHFFYTWVCFTFTQTNLILVTNTQVSNFILLLQDKESSGGQIHSPEMGTLELVDLVHLLITCTPYNWTSWISQSS